MSKGLTKCSSVFERSSETEVFQNMDKFELSEASKFDMSIRLQFPKFSKGFTVNDFESFIKSYVGDENLVAIGRLAFPNEWQMQVKSKEIRENLIRLGRTKINTRTCWISPLSQNEVRGYVHWLPNAISDKTIYEVLNPFGTVLFMEFSKVAKWDKVNSDSRYFAMHLTPGKTMDDLPHMFKLDGNLGLITVRGRRPCCFHCRDVGHRKSECKKYRDKLQGYCMRKPTNVKRTKPRGKRYKPNLQTGDQNEAKSTEESKSAQTKETGKKHKKSIDTKVPSKTIKTKADESKSAVDVTGILEKVSTASTLEKVDSASNLDMVNALAAAFIKAGLTLGTEIETTRNKLADLQIQPEEKDAPSCDSNKTSVPKKKSKKKKKKNAGHIPKAIP